MDEFLSGKIDKSHTPAQGSFCAALGRRCCALHPRWGCGQHGSCMRVVDGVQFVTASHYRGAYKAKGLLSDGQMLSWLEIGAFVGGFDETIGRVNLLSFFLLF